MQIRKLVKSGHSSLVTAIPSEWIKKNKLKPGDHIYLKEEGKRLIIEASYQEAEPAVGKYVLDTESKNEKKILHELTAAYMDSYKIIIIKGSNINDHLFSLKKRISDLVALELVEESSEKIIARSFLDIKDSSPSIVIRRIDNIIRSMFIDTKSALRKKEIIQNIVNRDQEVNKLSFLLYKILKSAQSDMEIENALQLNELQILLYWELNIHLEKIGDRVKHIAKIIPDIDSRNMKVFEKIFSEMNEQYLEVMHAFYKNIKDEAEEVSRRKDAYTEYIKRVIEKTRSLPMVRVAINCINMSHNINDIARAIRYIPN